MRIHILPWAVLAVLQASDIARAAEPVAPAGELLSPMLRASVFVHDLEESLKLYRDILGLRVRVARTLEGKPVNRVLGTRGKTVSLAILQSGDTLSGNVGLFSYGDGTQPPPAPNEVRTGDVAFVFITNDIHGIYTRVKAAGFTIVSPPMVLFPSDDPGNDSLEMLFFDRDGVAINLIQRPANQKDAD
ncbi:MAG: VOC family protein [Gammaproteobacteria bacterium]|nr:VOC family protein [Gammaproteobacteria bacterium]